MGTSGSYGGSKKQAWKNARQQILDLPSTDGPSSPGNHQDSASDKPLEELWESIADALDSDDPTLHEPTIDDAKISIPTLMPWLRGRGGGGSGGGAGAGGDARTGGGRAGSGSRRQMTRGAARGGTALGAAYAVRSGDRAYLEELGLDLTRLRGLSPARQCGEILDAVLGEGSHPDESALRKASLEALKEILETGDPPDEATALRTFVTSYVFELSLVELQKQVNEGALSAADVAQRERTIRRYLEARIQTVPIPGSGSVSPRDLRSRAAQLTKEVIKLLRASDGGTS